MPTSKWEEIDHDLEDSIAGALTGVGDGDGDPLGLGAVVEYVHIRLHPFLFLTNSQFPEIGYGVQSVVPMKMLTIWSH